MFNGIIKNTGKVNKFYKKNNNHSIYILSKLKFNKNEIGSSVSCSGACLTLEKHTKNLSKFYISKETLNRTIFKSIKKGDIVNLEKPLKYGHRVSGHFVQGHVDCIAQCLSIIDLNGSWGFQFQYPEEYKKYIVSKGSITINGVSLTISNMDDLNNTFEVNIIPYSFQHTNFSIIKVNDFVNVEFDIIGKYILKSNLNR